MANFLQQQAVSKDTSFLSSAGVTLFMGACFSAWYIYDIYMKQKELFEKVNELDTDIQEISSIQETHADTLHETDLRLREKKDYDETDEVEEGVYQAWKGVYTDASTSTCLKIWKEKPSTIKRNQDWLQTDHSASCIVRDFYLGNGDPEFHWKISETAGYVEETFVNGWDSVIKLKVEIIWLVKNEIEGSDASLNHLLSDILKKGDILWTRELLEIR